MTIPMLAAYVVAWFGVAIGWPAVDTLVRARRASRRNP